MPLNKLFKLPKLKISHAIANNHYSVASSSWLFLLFNGIHCLYFLLLVMY